MQLNVFKWLYPLFVLLALPASASTFGVFTKVSSGDAGDLEYATAPGIAVGYGGGLVTNITQYELSYSSTVTQPGATTAGLAISSVYNQNTADSATAYASLASGIMRSQIGAVTGVGITDQILQDSATFTVVGAPTSQIRVNAHLSGIATGVGLNAGQEANSLDFSLGGSFRWTAFVSNNGSSLASHFGPGGYYAPSGWDSYQFTNETVTGFDFTGLYTVTNGQPVTFREDFGLDCSGGAACDFSHTSSFSLVLPSNTSFTSASGVLLTQAGTATPEPGTMLLIVPGIAAAVLVRRRKSA